MSSLSEDGRLGRTFCCSIYYRRRIVSKNKTAVIETIGYRYCLYLYSLLFRSCNRQQNNYKKNSCTALSSSYHPHRPLFCTKYVPLSHMLWPTRQDGRITNKFIYFHDLSKPIYFSAIKVSIHFCYNIYLMIFSFSSLLQRGSALSAYTCSVHTECSTDIRKLSQGANGKLGRIY